MLKPTDPETLVQDGLIFEINRSVLHPLGYALAVQWDEKTNKVVKIFLMKTDDDDEEGVLFQSDNFIDGAAKFSAFMSRIGNEKLRNRIAKVGFIRQTKSNQ